MRSITNNLSGNKRKLLLGLFLATLVLLISAGTVVYVKSQKSPPAVPKDIRSRISGFQPYSTNPIDLPSGYKVDSKNVRYENNTLFFTVKSANKTVVVSVQSIPEEFKNTANFVGKESIDTKNGKATITFVEGRTSAFMITSSGDAFVILNSNSAVSTEDVRLILNSLQKI